MCDHDGWFKQTGSAFRHSIVGTTPQDVIQCHIHWNRHRPAIGVKPLFTVVARYSSLFSCDCLTVYLVLMGRLKGLVWYGSFRAAPPYDTSLIRNPRTSTTIRLHSRLAPLLAVYITYPTRKRYTNLIKYGFFLIVGIIGVHWHKWYNRIVKISLISSQVHWRGFFSCSVKDGSLSSCMHQISLNFCGSCLYTKLTSYSEIEVDQRI